jgi:hypothetical protein
MSTRGNRLHKNTGGVNDSGGVSNPFKLSTLSLYLLLSALYIIFSVYSFMNVNIEFICICALYSVHVLFTIIFCFGLFTNTEIMKGFSLGDTLNPNAETDGVYGDSFQLNSLFLLVSISGLLIGIITLTFVIVMYSYMRDYYDDINNPLQYLTTDHAEMMKNYKIIYIVTTGLSLVLGLIFITGYLDDAVAFIRNMSGIVISMAIISFCVLQIIWGKNLLDIKLNHLVS